MGPLKFAAACGIAVIVSGSVETRAESTAADKACGADAPALAGPAQAISPRSSGQPAPEGAGVTPVQVMGCVDREYKLRRISLRNAANAVALEDEPQSKAAVFSFGSPQKRDALIAAWLGEGAPSGYVPGKPTTFYIVDWANSHWSRPDGVTIYAIHPEAARSGKICLVRADTRAVPDALPVLNNWCMDRLDLWAD